LRSVHAADCFLGLLVVGHLHKSEASRLAGITVFQNGYVVYLAISGKRLAQIVFSDFEIEIPYVDIHRASFFGCVQIARTTGVTAGLVEDSLIDGCKVTLGKPNEPNTGSWADGTS
jgi:hypothetical protein